MANWNFEHNIYYSKVAIRLIEWAEKVKKFDRAKAVNLLRKAEKYERVKRESCIGKLKKEGAMFGYSGDSIMKLTFSMAETEYYLAGGG